MHYSDNEKRDIMLMNRKKTKNGYKNGWKRQSYLRQKRCRKNLSKAILREKLQTELVAQITHFHRP